MTNRKSLEETLLPFAQVVVVVVTCYHPSSPRLGAELNR